MVISEITEALSILYTKQFYSESSSMQLITMEIDEDHNYLFYGFNVGCSDQLNIIRFDKSGSVLVAINSIR